MSMGSRVNTIGTPPLSNGADVASSLESGAASDACGFRGNAATDSDGKRPPNPIESGHLIRTKAATLLTG